MPPTGNGVLNQIPAGDSRESSREQVMLADGALILHELPSAEARRSISSVGDIRELSGRATSLTHQKKKKKKWREAEAGVVWKWKLHMGSEVEAMRTQWYGSGGEEGIVECAGQRRVYTIRASLVVSGE